ncbi:MAG: M24 family metallopeptidase [Vulcanimicrobiota bacterium]
MLSPLRINVLVAAGEPISIPGGQDQTYPFLAHPHYYWLTGCRRAGGVLAFDPDGGWTDFRAPISQPERVWEGAEGEAGGEDVAGLKAWLEKRQGRPLAVVGAPPSQLSGDENLSERVCRELQHLRRPKDEGEVALVARAVEASARGYARVQEWLKPGVSEREVAIRLESEFFLGGCDRTGYGTIVGAGTNSAVLHWPASGRRMAAGELVLIDAGGSIDGYTADITRVYPVSGEWDARQKDLHAILLQAQINALEGCQIGVEWGDLHTRTASELAAGLRSLGVLRCSPEEAVESEAIALFFPHGLGHMLGLGVRDASGLAPGRSPNRLFAGARLRMDLPLEANYLVTVEPGLYFIPALLNDPEKRARHEQRVAWDELAPWIELGGMRIEDDVLVTPQGPRNLTAAIPKE